VAERHEPDSGVGARRRVGGAGLNKAGRLVILSVSVFLGIWLHEPVFYFVTAGAGWRLFTRDQPSQPSPTATVYFAGVLACLGSILWLMPGKVFGASNHRPDF
jgi:hypothetical protein